MTKGEAKAYLSINNEVDIEEHYDNFLFRQKEFFRQKPISKIIYIKQFSKIEQANEAFCELGFYRSAKITDFKLPVFNLEIKHNFNLYYSTKNQLLQKLYSVHSLSDVITIGNSLLTLDKEYATCYKEIILKLDKLETSNPMNVLKDINKLNSIGIYFITQLDEKKHSNFTYLLGDIYRLKTLLD